jgi:hypothetical protein
MNIKIEAPELVAAMNKLAEAMMANQAKPEPKAKKPAPAPAPTPEVEAPAPAPAAPVTLVQVRARLAELSSEGKKDAIKKLMADFGVSKLTEVPEEKYSELMTAAEAL